MPSKFGKRSSGTWDGTAKHREAQISEYQTRQKKVAADREAAMLARLSSAPAAPPSAEGRKSGSRDGVSSEPGISEAQARRLASLEGAKVSTAPARGTDDASDASARRRGDGSSSRPGSRPNSAAGVMRPISTTEERMLGRLEDELSPRSASGRGSRPGSASGSRSQSRRDQVATSTKAFALRPRGSHAVEPRWASLEPSVVRAGGCCSCCQPSSRP